MGLRVLHRDGVILSMGFCDYPNTIEESLTDLGNIDIPDNAHTHYEIAGGKLVKRETPLTEDEWSDLTTDKPAKRKKILSLAKDLVAEEAALIRLGLPAEDITAKIDSLKAKLAGI